MSYRKIILKEKNEKRLLTAMNLRLAGNSYLASKFDFYRELFRQAGYFFEFGKDDTYSPTFYIIHPFSDEEYMKRYGISLEEDYPEHPFREIQIQARDLRVEPNLTVFDRKRKEHHVYYRFFENSDLARVMNDRFHQYMNIGMKRYKKKIFPLMLKIVKELGDHLERKK